MSEIEKMYKNAGVKKEVIPCPAKYYGYDCTRNNWDDEDCSCDIEGYPPFTSEKQIELIKWLSRRYIEVSNYDAENGRMYNIKPTVGDFATSFNYDFSECIAGCINQLWQDLTEEEKQQVKEVLE